MKKIHPLTLDCNYVLDGKKEGVGGSHIYCCLFDAVARLEGSVMKSNPDTSTW